MSKPISDQVFDIGRDLQRAYDEGYKQGRYDEKVETETSLPSGEQTHALRTRVFPCVKRQDAIDATWFEPSYTDPLNVLTEVRDRLKALPSADRQTDEEDQLKFYYVESIDDYWIGMRIDNFYYADWHEGLGFVWSKSRHLPWGETVVDENTLWKVHTYPSKPVEIPFTDWIVGFVKKYFADRPTGEWIDMTESSKDVPKYRCSACGYDSFSAVRYRYCPNCGADMRGDTE